MPSWSERHKQHLLTLAVFLFAVVGYFSYYRVLNDHYPKLTRAREIVTYGAVPFRDFFDPGYFLTIYASALMLWIFGDNTFGELLLNISFMAAGTALVFVLTRRTSRSTVWGLLAAGMLVASQPRAYDYDKILFYALGLYACWNYSDQKTIKALFVLCATIVASGMFRYDSGVFIGAAGLIGIVATHWNERPIAIRRVATAGLLVLVLATPALLFIQTTAGLKDAVGQMMTFGGQRQDERSHLVQAAFAIDWSAPGLQRVLNRNNGATWLYYLAFTLSAAIALAALRQSSSAGATAGTAATTAKRLSFSTLTVLVAALILREPITAHLPTAIPLIFIGGAMIIDLGREWLGRASRTPVTRQIATASAAALALVTVVSVVTLIDLPPRRNLDFASRLDTFMRTPPALELLPNTDLKPLVEYLRACTTSSDRVLVAWFGSEAYFFAERGFAAGMPEVFRDHWAEPLYQQRSLRLLEQQSVPIILTMATPPIEHYELLWNFIQTHYDLAHDGPVGESPAVKIWVRRDRTVQRRYRELPCYAAE